ncbi:MAG: inositol monophosphatase family protein [Solirubrobacteraceae bacterium]
METGPGFETALLAVAEQAARAAGKELLARWRQPIEVSTKTTPTDPVSAADLAAEQAIRAVLSEQRPDDAVLGEEGGATGSGALRWVVDPLDGTVNYLYGFPAFAVSVAVRDASGWLAGVVFDPVSGELYSASASGEALLSGAQLSPSTCQSLAQALIGTGFAYGAQLRSLQAQEVSRVLPRARDIRRIGSAALDMCWCAAGRLDAYYERDVKEWDIAAGTLICQRAGLTVMPLPAHGGLSAGVLVAPASLVDELLALVDVS